MDLQQQMEHMDQKIDETHDMVKEMYSIVVGTENYKEGSLMFKLSRLETKVNELEVDKIKRDATIKTVGVVAGLVGGVIGYLIALFLKQ